jgi:ATP-binding cassette subfamily B protein
VTLAEKTQKKVQQFPYLVKALGLLWESSPRWTVAWACLLAIQGLLPVAIVYLTRLIIDNLVLLINTGKHELYHTYSQVLIPVGIMVIVFLCMAVIRSCLQIIRADQSQIVQDKISSIIQDKSSSIDLAYYESSEYYDKLHRARNDASFRPIELMESLSTLFQNSITLIAMMAIIAPFGVWAPAALLISTMPVLYVVMKHRLYRYNWKYRNTNKERQTWYYDWLLSSRENAAEIRMFELGNYFRTAFSALRKQIRHDSLQLHKSQAFAELGAAVFALLITGAAMGFMVWKALLGTVSIGSLAMFYQAFNQGQRLLRSLLENVGQMYSNSLFLGDMFDFFNLEPQVSDPAVPQPLPDNLAKGITFQNVDFYYPFCTTPVLQGFDFFIPAGKITAVVGANGAGKSTLVKLLCRLYDPASGKIFFDDIDIKQCRISNVRKMITVLFQESARFNASIAENIGLGDLEKSGDMPLIEEAAKESGADAIASKTPGGYEAQLGRWFSGSIDISGGEWQRIALARAFLRKSPIIILDEPTSSMDSWSEMDWVKRFRLLARSRTGIIIAHRFTTAMQADIIHVMDNGTIVESGSHQELISQNGKYAASWKEQMRNGNEN